MKIKCISRDFLYFWTFLVIVIFSTCLLWSGYNVNHLFDLEWVWNSFSACIDLHKKICMSYNKVQWFWHSAKSFRQSTYTLASFNLYDVFFLMAIYILSSSTISILKLWTYANFSEALIWYMRLWMMYVCHLSGFKCYPVMRYSIIVRKFAKVQCSWAQICSM